MNKRMRRTPGTALLVLAVRVIAFSSVVKTP
jgi:hypothetical protein